MKVVLFCGGLGTRLREHSDTIPKPLVSIGYRPIIWHLMRYYAHYGHKEFILCLGYRGDMIKHFFQNYDECVSNDFTMKAGGREIILHNTDIEDWTISFVDTGLNSNIGQRMVAVRDYVKDEEYFLANYSDGLSDLPLNRHIELITERGATAGFVGVRAQESMHTVRADTDGWVSNFGPMAESEFWVNGGFFVLRPGVFDYFQPGEEFVEQPFARLIADRQLVVNRYRGFWRCMDTLRDKLSLDQEHASGNAPWEVWKARSSEEQRVALLG